MASPGAPPTSSTSTTPAAKHSPAAVPATRPSDLVVRLEGVGDTCCPAPLAVLTADGRFVTRTDDNQLRERKLTPAGVQRVRDELVATGLFERDQRFPLELRPGASGPQRGVGGLFFKVWRDTRNVEVATATDQGADEVLFQPSPARTRLDRLSKQLLKPETWLPADAWADPTPRRYEPAAFALLLRVEHPGAYNARPTIDELSATWPFSVGPLALGEALPPGAGPFDEPTRCIALTKDDMLAVKDAIVRSGGSDAMQTSPDDALLVGFGTQDQQSGLDVMIRPLLPDRSSCSGEYAQ
jgi:hypothetical protein